MCRLGRNWRNWEKAMDEPRIEAQRAADELFIESRLRFELTVHRVEPMELSDHYTIYFVEGRMGPLARSLEVRSRVV